MLVFEVFIDLGLGVPVFLAIEIDTILFDFLAVQNVLLSLLLHAPLLINRLHVQITSYLCLHLFRHLHLQVLVNLQLAEAGQVC